MVNNLVRQIKLTEEKAKQNIAKAKDDANKSLEDAHNHVAHLREKAEKDAKDEQKRLLEKAHQKAQNEVVQVRKGNELKRNKLNDIAEKNLDKAKRFVADNLINRSNV